MKKFWIAIVVFLWIFLLFFIWFFWFFWKNFLWWKKQEIAQNIINNPYITPKIIWENCNQEKFENFFQENEEIPFSLECSFFEVPLDYNHKNLDTISLALTRLPSENAQAKNLIVIAWWPGQSGLNFASRYLDESEYTWQLQKYFHIISYAPRWVFPSSPFIDCWDASDEDSWRDFVKKCAKNSQKNILKNISTFDAMEDVEEMRKWLWEEKISILGFSYGTKVLAYYTQKYGQNLRAGIFDGVVDIMQNYFEMRIEQEKWFQKAFDHFVEFCLQEEYCIFENNENASEFFVNFLIEIEKKELTDQYGNTIFAHNILTMVTEDLYREDSWLSLLYLLYDLKMESTEVYNEYLNILHGNENLPDETEENGGNSENSINNQNDENNEKEEIQKTEKERENDYLIAINCADYALPFSERKSRDYIQRMKEVESASEFNEVYQYNDEDFLDACFYWGTPGRDFTQKMNFWKNFPQLLFVSYESDPTTPVQNAVNMAKYFNNSPMLIKRGNGHTMSFSLDDSCVNEFILNYLKNPWFPIKNMICE